MTRKLPIIITQEEFEKMFKVALKSNLPRAKEYSIAILLGFEAGMRISEIVGLHFEGVWRIKPLQKEQIEDNHIRILQGKGGKDRVVPRPKRLNHNAVKLLPLNIKRRALQHFVKQLGLGVLNKNISFHTLRHGFATHFHKKTGDVRTLQTLLGHSRLDTTSIYAHVNPEEAIKKAQDVF